MLHVPTTQWQEAVIRSAYFCQADILKNMLHLNPEALDLTDEGLLLAEFPLANYSEGSLAMEKGIARPTAQNQADTLEVILRAMGSKKASQDNYCIKTIGKLPYGKNGEEGMVFDSYGNTILHMIAFYEGAHFLPVLRKVGLDISAMAKYKNSKNQTPIDIALNMMANMPLAFAIQQEVTAYECDKIRHQLNKVQKQNKCLVRQIEALKAEKVTSWSVSGAQEFDRCNIIFR